MIAQIIVLLLTSSADSRELIAFPFLKNYQSQTKGLDECISTTQRFALTVAQPVYRNGETVVFYLYQYHLHRKIPLYDCLLLAQEIKVFDSNDTEKGEAIQQNETKVFDYSIQEYSFKVPKSFLGGVYFAKISNYNEKVKFFVLHYDQKHIGLMGDWNLNIIKAGDLLRGKVSLQTLGREFSSFKKATFNYVFKNADGTIYKETKSSPLKSQEVTLSFQVPSNFAGSLLFELNVKLDNDSAGYSKEFREAQYDDIVVEFNYRNRKLVEGVDNLVYFQAFKDESRKEVVDINQGQLLKKCGNKVDPIGKVDS